MRRTLLAAVAIVGFALPVSAAVISFAPSAYAGSSSTCTKIIGSGSAGVTVENCSNLPAGKAAKGFKKLSTSDAAILIGGGTLTWSKSGDTVTFSAPSFPTQSSNPCKSTTKKGVTTQDTYEVATGTVTQGDGVVTHTGDTYSIEVCVSSKNGKLYLPPGGNIQI